MNFTEKKEFLWFQCRECLRQFDNMNQVLDHSACTGHRAFLEIHQVTLRKVPFLKGG